MKTRNGNELSPGLELKILKSKYKALKGISANLRDTQKSLIARLKADNGLYRSLLMNNAVSDGLRGKLRDYIALNEQEIKKAI